ncbi:MAG: LysE family translocator [Actinomycetota bacterium]
MNLERQYRLLLRAFPRRWRRERGDELVTTLLDGSRPDQRVASAGDVVDVVCRGFQRRIADAGPRVQVVAAFVVLLATTAAVHLAVTPTPGSFLITSLVVVLIPGTGVIFSVSTAIAAGWRDGGLAAIGCTLGIVPHLLAASLGLSGLMQTSAEAFEVVRWAGVCYLAWLGVSMLRSSGSAMTSDEPVARRSGFVTIRRGILLNLLNPKLTLFFFAFLPQFLSSTPTTFDGRLLGLSAVFMAMTLAVFLVYVAAASGVRERILGTPVVLRRIERAFGAVLVGFALRLAVAER